MAYPADFSQGIFVRQQFLIADYHAPAKLEIQTEFHGLYAENARALLARIGLKQLTQTREQQLTHFYPKAQTTELGHWQDDQKHNRVLVTERYAIPDFFDYADGYFVSKYFMSLDALPGLNTSKQPSRATPFVLASPFEFRQTTEVKLPSSGQATPLESHSVDNPHLYYRATRLQAADSLHLAHQLQILQEWAPPDALAQYQADIQKIRGKLVHTLVRTVAAQSDIQRIYASFPAVASGALSQGDEALYQEAARIQAAIETGQLSESQRQRAQQQFYALRLRLNLPPHP